MAKKQAVNAADAGSKLECTERPKTLQDLNGRFRVLESAQNYYRKRKACYCLNSRLANAGKAYLVGPAGVEPTTNGLKVRCSTN